MQALVNGREVRLIDRKTVESKWAARGFSCGLWTDPADRRWEDFVHNMDEVVMVINGSVEFEIGDRCTILSIQSTMRRRVWEAANVKLAAVTIDTDTTVHTIYGSQMGGRKSYNPKNKGKKSYQPMLTFVAETREYLGADCAREIGQLPSRYRITWSRRREHYRRV